MWQRTGSSSLTGHCLPRVSPVSLHLVSLIKSCRIASSNDTRATIQLPTSLFSYYLSLIYIYIWKGDLMLIRGEIEKSTCILFFKIERRMIEQQVTLLFYLVL